MQNIEIYQNYRVVYWNEILGSPPEIPDIDKAYVDASLSTRDVSISELYSLNETQDSSIDELYARPIADVDLAYVDGSLAARDSSIAGLYSWNTAQDASIEALWLSPQDPSIEDIYGTALFGVENAGTGENLLGLFINVDGFAGVRSKSLIAGDNIIISSTADEITITADAGAVMDYAYVDGSLGARDASIAELSNDLENHILDGSVHFTLSEIPQDASIVDLYQEIENLPKDASIAELYTDLDTHVSDDSIHYTLSEIPQDASISDLYQEIENLPKDASIAELYQTKLSNTSDTFTGLLTIDGSLHISGDIYQDGSTYVVHAEEIRTKNDFLTLREDSFLPLIDGSISGIRIIAADGTNDVIFGTENDALLRVGWEGDILQAVATREDSPLDDAYAYWDDASTIFKTRYLSQDPSVSDHVNNADIHFTLSEIPQDPSILSLYTKDLDQDSSIDELYARPIADVDLAYVDGSLALRDASIEELYSEISNIQIDGYVQESSLGSSFVWDGGILDVSVEGGSGGGGTLALSGLVQDTSIVDVSTNDMLLYTGSRWENAPATDISEVLVDVGELMVEAEEFFYTKDQIDSSFYDKGEIDLLISDVDVSVKGAINMDTGLVQADASIYGGLDASGNIQFKKLVGTTAVKIIEFDSYIDINIDASFSGEVNAGYNIPGGDASVFIDRDVFGQLDFRSFKTNTPEVVSLMNDASFVYVDVVASSSLDGLTDVDISDVSTNDMLLYTGTGWENAPATDISEVLVDVGELMVEAEEFFYTKDQIDGSIGPIQNTIDGLGSMALMNFWTGDASMYDAIDPKDSSTIYFIKE
jgi:hypothetical protein